MAIDLADKLWLMADQEIYQGAPEDLLINKVFRKLLLNSPAEFDEKTSTFRLKRDLKRTVIIQGEKRYRLMTKKAMERIGFQAVESESERSVVVVEQEGAPVWQYTYRQVNLAFTSLYNLATHIKINH